LWIGFGQAEGLRQFNSELMWGFRPSGLRAKRARTLAGKKKLANSSEELANSLRELGNSLRKIHNSLPEIHKSKREICISLGDLCISSGEICVFLFPTIEPKGAGERGAVRPPQTCCEAQHGPVPSPACGGRLTKSRQWLGRGLSKAKQSSDAAI